MLVDLDGTLIDTPSSERRFIAELMRRGVLGPAQWWAASIFLLRHSPRFGRDVIRKNKAYLAGLRCERVEALGKEFVTQNLEPALRGFMLERLQRHQGAGDKLVLLTGAPDFIAVPLARHLRMDACCATVCHRRGDRFTAQAPTRHPFGWDKRRLAEVLCAGEGCTLRDCVAYADARHDLPLLEAVGRAVAVTPDRGLAQSAARQGWEIITPGPLYAELGDSRSHRP